MVRSLELLALGLLANAQQVPPGGIRPGETRYETLVGAEGAAARFELSGGEGEALTIELRSYDFDALLRVEDGQGRILAEDDDGGVETNARLLLSADRPTGAVLVIRSKVPGQEGEFSLSIERGELPPLAQAAEQEAAIVFRSVAAERALERGDRSAAAEHRLREGDWRYARSQFDEAERSFRSAGELSADTGIRWIEAQAHTGLGRCAFARSELPVALTEYETALELHRTMGARLDQGRTLLNLGIVHEVRRDFLVAEGCYEGALGLAEAEADAFGRARALTKLGNLERLRGKREAAREHLELGLELSRQLGDRPGECSALEGLGHWWVTLGRQQEGLPLFERWLAIAREGRDRASEAAALNSLAVVHGETGDPSRAIEYAQRALLIAGEVGDRQGQATALGNLGVEHQILQDWHQAIEFHERHLSLALEIGDRQGEERARSNLATCWRQLGDSGAEEAQLLERLAAARKTGELKADWGLLTSIAGIRRGQGRYDEARALLEEALAIQREVEMGFERPWLLREFGLLLVDQKQYEAAIGYLQRSLRGVQEEQNDEQELFTSMELGQALRLAGDPSGALEHVQRAADLARQSGLRQATVRSLFLLGRTQLELGFHDAARGSLDRALELARERDLADLEASVLLQLAFVALERDGLEAARLHIDSHHALRPKESFPASWAASTSTLGWFCYLSGFPDEALNLTEQALDAYEGLGDLEGPLIGRGNLALIHFDLGAIELAERLASEVLAEWRDRGAQDLLSLADPLWVLARTSLAQGRLESAKEHTETLGTLIEQSLRHGYRGGVGLGALNYALVAWEQLRQDVLWVEQSQGDQPSNERAALLASGLREAGRSKARALLGGMVEHRRGGRSREAIELRQRRGERINEREHALDRLARAVSDKLSVAESDSLRHQASDLEREIAELERTLREVSPRDARLDFPEGVSPDQVRSAAIAPGDALVEYVEGDRRLRAYVVTPHGLDLVDLGDRREIERSAAEFLMGISTPESLAGVEELIEAGHRLGGLLLAPVVELAGPDLRRLIVVPTAALSGLPFEALVVGDAPRGTAESLASAQFAIDRWEIVYAPSAPVLVELASLGPRRREGKVLVLADPVYASEPDVPEAPEPSEVPSLLGGVRSMPDAHEFQRLAKTRDEALAIADLLASSEDAAGSEALAGLRRKRSGSASTRLLDLHLGREASASRLRGDLKPYAVLHLAAHGFVDRSQADHSGIALAFDGKDEQQGYFTVADALDLDLDANLVVLSACDTGKGRRRPGEGVESLARAFMFAGARGVVASLWQVSDWAAAETMVTFYRGALERGLPPGQALREAKLALRRSTAVRGVGLDGGSTASAASAHPFFWAPFVYVGRPE